MVTGESTKETVKTIAQGMPVDAAYLSLLTPVLFYCTGGYGCLAHPAFPAPSVILEGGSCNNSDACVPREQGLVSTIMLWPILRDAAGAAPQDEVVACGAMSDPHGEEARQRRLEP
jgi:hypothetical protein